MDPISAPRGTNDIFPPESAAWNELEAHARDISGRFGYGEIRTPMFEATELFVRGVGETTDIVEKEMYTFLDKGGRSMTLRPEWTAPVVRAVLEHKLLAPGALRLFYIGPFFRYERPQKGRYRQANQFGVECLGFAGPGSRRRGDADRRHARRPLRDRRRATQAQLDRRRGLPPAYRDALLAHFTPHRQRAVGGFAPPSGTQPAAHPRFEGRRRRPVHRHGAGLSRDVVRRLRGALCRGSRLSRRDRIAYVVDPRLVRGFDYYTRTVFEISSSALGSQSALCGGGRYDGLFESLGGPPTPAVGFGLGLERFLMVVKATRGDERPARRGFQAIALGAASRGRLVPIVAALRSLSGIPAFMDFADRKLTAHFKTADRNGARYALIMGDEELAAGQVVLRDLQTREDRRIPTAAAAADTARALVEATG